MDEGYWKFHRCMEDSALWSLSDGAFRVAIHLISRANYKASYFKGEPLQPGDLVESLQTIASRCKKSRSHIQKILKKLEEVGFISIRKSNQRFQVITICNWAKYQLDEVATDTPVPSPKKTSFNPMEYFARDEYAKLHTPEIKSALQEWIAGRKKPTEGAMKRNLKVLMALSATDAEQCLDEAIKGGWQGLHPPRHQQSRRRSQAQF